jgi:hypothetical protein
MLYLDQNTNIITFSQVVLVILLQEKIFLTEFSFCYIIDITLFFLFTKSNRKTVAFILQYFGIILMESQPPLPSVSLANREPSFFFNILSTLMPSCFVIMYLIIKTANGRHHVLRKTEKIFFIRIIIFLY